jgi:hypothetical protein
MTIAALLMTNRRRTALMCVVVTLITCLSTAAAAQSVEADIDYAWLNDHGFHYPVGWAASAALSMTRWLFVVGEIDGNYHRDHIPNLPSFTYAGQAYTVNTHTFAGGPRARLQVAPTVAAFGQVLFGTQRIAGIPDAPFDWSRWSFLVQPGGGAAVRVSQRIDIRFSVDVPLVRTQTFASGPSGLILDHEFARLVRVAVGAAFTLDRRK